MANVILIPEIGQMPKGLIPTDRSYHKWYMWNMIILAITVKKSSTMLVFKKYAILQGQRYKMLVLSESFFILDIHIWNVKGVALIV